MVAGDFNAMIGTREDYDDPDIIGHSPAKRRNARGDMLLRWCTAQRLAVTNTFGLESFEKTWTFRHSDVNRKQVDYVLCDVPLKKHVLLTKVLEDVIIGSDHRPLFVEAKMHTRQDKRKKREGTTPTRKADAAYTPMLSNLLQENANEEASIENKHASIQNAMLQAARASGNQQKPDHHQPRRSAFDLTIHNLIEQRRDIAQSFRSPAEKKKARVVLGKLIQQTIKKRMVAQQTENMQEVLANFEDLRQLQHLGGRRRCPHIIEIHDEHGDKKREKKAIADVLADFYEDLYNKPGLCQKRLSLTVMVAFHPSICRNLTRQCDR